MRLGVVSDTHGNVLSTHDAVRMLESLEIDVVLHCGDIGGTRIVELFTPWPTHFVRGNVDLDNGELANAISAAGQHDHGRFGDLLLEGRRVALIHSDDARRFAEVVRSGDYDLVCYGHTHRAESHRVGNTLVLNPGALHRASPHSLAIVDLPELTVQHVTL